jgi:NAD(P)-dependent dehydrogenase (short-subunit alcohol dehydrogenase family)
MCVMARIALVTGGGQGIGAEVCAQLAASGLQVVVTDIHADKARGVATALGAQHQSRHLDVCDEAQVKQVFAEVERDVGPVSVLVCVAGLLIHDHGDRIPFHEMTTENWEKTFAVNTRGVFFCARELLALRQDGKAESGRIVTFGSVAAQLGGYRSSSSYIAAKAGVMSLTKAMARESAHLGFTVNCAPGLIDTEMLRSTVQSSGALSAAAANIPLGRIGSVQDVAGAVKYFVSEEAGYITGSVIDVNGGYRMQ